QHLDLGSHGIADRNLGGFIVIDLLEVGGAAIVGGNCRSSEPSGAEEARYAFHGGLHLGEAVLATAARPLCRPGAVSVFHRSTVEQLHGLVDGADAFGRVVVVLVLFGLVFELIDLVFQGVGQLTLVHGFIQLVDAGRALVIVGKSGRGK